MGLFGLQMMVPWCFHMVHGRDDDDESLSSNLGLPIRVIGSDGRVQLYDRPVSASELMREFPTHLICHSDSFFIGHKLPPLSHDEHLQLGNTYFLLPNHFFHSVLSFVTVATSLLTMSTNKKMMKPFDIHRTDKGMLQIRISEDVLMDMIKEEDDHHHQVEEKEKKKYMSRICTTEELEKEYSQLANRREWKTRLETIPEHRKRRSWFRMQLLFRRNNIY